MPIDLLLIALIWGCAVTQGQPDQPFPRASCLLSAAESFRFLPGNARYNEWTEYSSTEPCTWHGVDCKTIKLADGDLTTFSLNLTGEGLEGGVVDASSLLTHFLSV